MHGVGGRHTGHGQGVCWEIGPKNYRLLKREHSGNFRKDDQVGRSTQKQQSFK